MDKAKLFQRKGELEWAIQVAQSELVQINQALVKLHNDANKEEKNKEE